MLIDIRELIYYLDLHIGSVVSVVGSGGKTTLIEELAQELSKRCRVCVAASTKMKRPSTDENIHLIIKNGGLTDRTIDCPGIYYAADEQSAGNKIHGFSQEMVDWARNHTDIILIEADGSHTLPLKGWADYEPVIIDETRMTIGVMPVYLLGQKAGPQNIHRFSLFSRMTGVNEGDILTREHLIRAITSPQGLFGKAKGEKVLFFSQVSDEKMEEDANAIASDQRLDFIDKIVIGSLRP